MVSTAERGIERESFLEPALNEALLAYADFEVLKQYPFERLRPARVVYESTHLSNIDNNLAAAFMMRLGYANILGGLGKVGLVVWHHLNSTETYNASFLDANGNALPLVKYGHPNSRQRKRIPNRKAAETDK
jgi:hypothetical protein